MFFALESSLQSSCFQQKLLLRGNGAIGWQQRHCSKNIADQGDKKYFVF